VIVRMPPQPGDATSLGQKIASLASTPENPAVVRQVDSVGSQVGDELYANSLMAVGLSLVMMMLYVAVRFTSSLPSAP
jgi:preprotein translocase subunit SecF